MQTRVLVIMLVLIPTLSVTSLTAADEEPIEVAEFPRFNELLDWVNFVRRDGFALLKAVKQNGYFVAVFCDKDGNIAVCTKELNPAALRFSQSSYSVADEKGKEIHDIDKKRLPSLGRSFKRKLPCGGFVTIGILDGNMLALKKGEYKQIRVTFSTGVESPRDKTVFDETVEYR